MSPDGEDHRAVQQRHRDRAGEVPGDRAVDDAPDVVGPLAAGRWHEPAGTADDRVAVEQDGDRGDEHEQRRAEPAEEARRQLADRVGVEPARQVVDELLGAPDGVPLLEALADHRPAVELLDRLRHLLGERARLIDGLRTEQQHDPAEHERQGDRDDQRRRGAAAPQPLPQDAHHRVEGETEQHAQQQRREHGLRRADEREDGQRQQHAARDQRGGDHIDAYRRRGIGDIPAVGHGAVQYRRWPTPPRAGRAGRRPSLDARAVRPLARWHGACWSPPTCVILLVVVVRNVVVSSAGVLGWAIASIVAAVLLTPLVSLLDRVLPRALAIIIVFLAVAAIGVGVRSLYVTQLQDQVDFLAEHASGHRVGDRGSRRSGR